MPSSSWGAFADPSPLHGFMADAIGAAHDAGVVFVAAAGNESSEVRTFFPANVPQAVAVSACTRADTRAAFSNFGAKLDVGAPGGGDGPPPNEQREPRFNILSLRSSAIAPANRPSSFLVLGEYLRLAGTSMAAPHVSGVAALVLAAQPGASVEQVRQILRSTADDVGPPGPDVDTGYGRVNAARAVTAPAPREAFIATPAHGTRLGETALEITGNAQGPGFGAYALSYAPAGDLSAWTPIAGPVATPVSDGVLATWAVGDIPDGEYILRLQVERPGAMFEDRVWVRLRNVAIDSPAALSALGTRAPIEIRGTAAGGGFGSYAVEYRFPAVAPDAWRSDGITLAAPPGTPVRGGLLATFDPSGITGSQRIDFRVVVQSGAGRAEWMRQGLSIDPALRPGWPRPVVAVPDRGYVTVADVDGDGSKEIVVGSGAEVMVLAADGSVRPGWPQPVAAGGLLATTKASPLVADVTGDARPEIVATNYADLYVWSADGVLQAGFPRTVDAFAFSANAWLAAVDIDHDGKDEIVCIGALRGDAYRGDGTAVPGWQLSFDQGMPPAVGDVEGDGPEELALFDERSPVVGSGTLLLFRAAGEGLPGWGRRSKGVFFTHAAMADFDGDGRLDPVIPNEARSGKVITRAFTAAGRKVPMTVLRGVRSRDLQRTARLLALADVDRDGRAEAWLHQGAANELGQPFVADRHLFVPYQWRKTPALRAPFEHRIFQTASAAGIAVGDVDGDAQQEVVAGTAGLEACGTPCPVYHARRRAVVASHLDGTLVAGFPRAVPTSIPEPDDPKVFITTGSSDDLWHATPAIADLDGDGLKEIVWFDDVTSSLFVWDVPGVPGPEVADWPMYRHDPRHTNVLPPTR